MYEGMRIFHDGLYSGLVIVLVGLLDTAVISNVVVFYIVITVTVCMYV